MTRLRIGVFFLAGSVVACAGSTGLTTGSTIPEMVFPALCNTFMDQESIEPGEPIAVVNTTRPVYSMLGLHFAYTDDEITPSEGEIDLKREESYRSSFEPERIDVPPTGKCQWYEVESLKSSDISEALVLELSEILLNPYAQRAQQGLFARFSYGGGTGAGWYWVALEQRQSGWRLIEVVFLDVYDN